MWCYAANTLARAAMVVAAIAIIEAAAVRFPAVILERSVVLRSGPSEATTRLHALLSGGYWRFLGAGIALRARNWTVYTVLLQRTAILS